MLRERYLTLIRTARRRPGLFLVGFLLPLLFFSIQLQDLQIVTDLRSLIPFDQVARTDSTITDRFDIRDRILVVLQGPESAFNTQTIGFAAELEQALEELPGVVRTRSLFTEEDIRGEEGGIRIEPFVPSMDSAGVAAGAESARAFPRLRGLLVATDERSVALLLEIDDDGEKANIVRMVRTTVGGLRMPHSHEVLISGMPVYEGVLGELILSDLLRMLPLVGIGLVLVLYAAFGSTLFAILCLVETVFVVVFTLGLMASLGQPLFILQAIMPVILMGIAVTDEVHIFARYFQEVEENSGGGLASTVERTMLDVGRPVFLTSLTTALAFLTFLSSSMPALRSFGLFAAIGVIVAMVFSLLVTPTALTLFGAPQSTRHSHRWDVRGLVRLGSMVAKNPRVYAVMALVLAGLLTLGITRLYIQDSWMSNFDPNSQIRRDDAVITASFGGTMQLQIELDTGHEGGIHSVEFIRGVNAFQEEIDSALGIGGSFSFVQPLYRLNEALTGRLEAPRSSGAATQLMSLLSDSGYRNYWDFEERRALVTVFVRDANYVDSFVTLPQIRRGLAEYLPKVPYALGGHYSLGIHWVDLIRTDLPRSLILSFIAVLAASGLVLKSFRKGLTVTAPIAVAVMMSFAGLGHLGVPIGVALSMFCAIVLGLGIDYAIHLHDSLETAMASGRAREAAVGRAFRTAGPPILWSASAVVCSFIVLLTSGMPPIQELGLMVAIGVTSAVLATFVFLPQFFLGRHRDSPNQLPTVSGESETATGG
ncbi:RND family transporter [Gemmatimonadota bacterium]